MSVFVNQEYKVTFTIKDEATGVPINLTGEIVEVLILSPAGVETVGLATVEDAPNGVCSYTFPTDTLTKGRWRTKPRIQDIKTPGTVVNFDVLDIWKG